MTKKELSINTTWDEFEMGTCRIFVPVLDQYIPTVFFQDHKPKPTISNKMLQGVNDILDMDENEFARLEDILGVEAYKQSKFKVIIPRLPHISNHTDFDPLRLHPDIDCQYISHLEEIPPADLIVLPGSKNVGFDLAWLKSQGWQEAINKHLRYGGKLIGICGGLQMLGSEIHDPLGIEGKPQSHHGLNLLDFETSLQKEKQLTNETGMLLVDGNEIPVQGYEIHAGITTGDALNHPALTLNNKPDGAISEDNQILVSYLHGLFDSTEALKALLDWAGVKTHQDFDINIQREQQLERLADAIEEHLDMEKIIGITQ